MATSLWFRSGLLGNLGTPDPLWNTSGIGGYSHSLFDASRKITPGAVDYNGATPSSGAATLGGLDGVVSTGGVGSTETNNTVAGPTSGINATSSPVAKMFFSPIVAADFTLSGTVTFNIWGSENSMSANVALCVALYRVDNTGAMTLIVKSTDTVGELGTTMAKRTWTATPTSTAMKRGDRIAAWVMYIDGGGTMASGFTASWRYNASVAASSDSNFTLTETVTWESAPTGTTYFLRSTASDIAGKKALSTTQGAGASTAVHTTQTGPRTYPGDQWTDTAGGSAIEWLTPQLSAFTLGGVAKCNIPFAGQPGDDFTTPFDGFLCEIAIVDSDGVSNPVIWARSYSPNDYSLGWPQILPVYISGPNTSVGQGKRLRFRMYHEDFTASNNSVSGTNRTFNYDGTGTSAASIQFVQSITEATLGPVAQHAAPPDVAKKGMVVAVNRASFW